MNRSLWLTTVALICVAGVAIGLTTRRALSPAPRIALDPPTIDLKGDHFKGQPVRVRLDLKNESGEPVTIDKISKSCGCMAFSDKGGGLVKTPFELAGHAVFPMTLDLSTGGRFGPEDYTLSISARDAHDRPAEAQAVVRLNVAVALHAEPRMIIFRRAKPAVPLSADIKLADALPDPGVAIREVKVSNQSTMRVAVEEQSGPSDLFGADVPGRARATLKLTYTPDAPEGRLHEQITVVPVDEKHPVLQIPVYCEIAEQPFRFMPRSLTIQFSGATTFRRAVTFVSDEPSATVSVARSPNGIEVKIGEPIEKRRTIDVAGDVSALSQERSEIVFLINGDEVVFPITKMALD